MKYILSLYPKTINNAKIVAFIKRKPFPILHQSVMIYFDYKELLEKCVFSSKISARIKRKRFLETFAPISYNYINDGNIEIETLDFVLKQYFVTGVE